MLGSTGVLSLNYGSPVNRVAPLNRNLRQWRLVLPLQTGGSTWLSLVDQQPGTLTAMLPSDATRGWGPTTRPGGRGELRFDGTSYVATPPYQPLSPFTVSLWFKASTWPAAAALYSNQATVLDIESGAVLRYWSDVTLSVVYTVYTFDLGTWYHVGLTQTGTTYTMYINGTFVQTGTTNALGTTPTSNAIGNYTGAAGRVFNGAIDDVAVWERALSAQEMAARYTASRLGYPHELAWQAWSRFWAVRAAISGAVPSGIIAMWSGTNATIPGGWTRVTALDGRYPKGAPAATDGGGTGGALTHTHTTPTHTHTTAHTHTVPDTTGTSGSSARDTGTTNPPAVHTHASNPAAQNPVTSLATDTPSTDAVNHEPPYYTVIFLSSNGTALGFPASVLSLWHEAAGAPAGWGLCDGGAGRPDLRGKYLKGAATAGDGGGTGGGATHTHAIASHSHTTPYAHGHPDVTSSQRTEALTTGTISGGAANVATATHTHTLTIASASPAITANTDAAGSTNHEPPYWLVALIQNTSGALSWPNRLIGLWTGTLATIPTNWRLCDGTNGTPDLRSLFIQGATTVAGVGSGGGSVTHGHTATGHTHAVAAHVHPVTGGVGASESRTAGATNAPTDTHTHTWPNTGSTSFTSGTETPSVDDYTDTQPPFTNVVFIQWQVPGVQKAPPPARRPWRIFWRAA